MFCERTKGYFQSGYTAAVIYGNGLLEKREWKAYLNKMLSSLPVFQGRLSICVIDY